MALHPTRYLSLLVFDLLLLILVLPYLTIFPPWTSFGRSFRNLSSRSDSRNDQNLSTRRMSRKFEGKQMICRIQMSWTRRQLKKVDRDRSRRCKNRSWIVVSCEEVRGLFSCIKSSPQPPTFQCNGVSEAMAFHIFNGPGGGSVNRFQWLSLS